jgi:hypothetical protein
MGKKDEIELEIQTGPDENSQESQAINQKDDEAVSLKEEVAEMKEHTKKAIQKIKDTVKEEDPKLSPTVTLRTILGGDFLTAERVRHQIGLMMVIVIFAIIYVAFRYQCQQDLITIDKMEKELLDAKYKALSSSSTLTEKCRESHVLDALKNNKDSILHISDQPPYIINIPE